MKKEKSVVNVILDNIESKKSVFIIHDEEIEFFIDKINIELNLCQDVCSIMYNFKNGFSEVNFLKSFSNLLPAKYFKEIIKDNECIKNKLKNIISKFTLKKFTIFIRDFDTNYIDDFVKSIYFMSDLQEYITLIILGSEDVFKEFKEKINSISRIDNTVR